VRGHHAGGEVLLVVLVDVQRDLAILRLQHAIAIADVDKGADRRLELDKPDIIKRVPSRGRLVDQ